MSIAIIANPTAGRGRGERVTSQIMQYLSVKNIDVKIERTTYPQHAIALAKRAASEHETVVAIGGDGTIREVLEGIGQTKARLGIIPGGTGNDFARGLAIPRKPKEALDVVLAGYSRLLDVAVERDRIFGVSAAIGFPVTVIDHVNSHQDILRGPVAIIAGVWRTLKNLQSHHVSLTIDGVRRELHTVAILVMNMPYAGGGLMFAPTARYDDGLLSVLIVHPISRGDLAKTLPKIYRGEHISHPKVELIQGKTICIEADNLQKMFDGDLYGSTPLDVSIHPGAAKVIVSPDT